jgi:Flp pilus assembly protein TadD
MGRNEEAIGNYEQVVKVQPDNFEAHNNLAALLARAGRVTEAIGHFEQAVRLKPDHLEMHMNLAVAYAAAGRFTEAIASAERARGIAMAAGDMGMVGKIDDWIAACRARAQTAGAQLHP